MDPDLTERKLGECRSWDKAENRDCADMVRNGKNLSMVI